jgi:hypothetical protein
MYALSHQQAMNRKDSKITKDYISFRIRMKDFIYSNSPPASPVKGENPHFPLLVVGIDGRNKMSLSFSL